MIDYEKELNEEQLKIVRSPTTNPILVIAGPGSGKTRTLVYRVCHLLENGVRPENLLLLTFTNKAAREMKRRVTGLAGKESETMIAGTFHHFCNLLLRKHGSKVGFKPNFTILDADDARSLLKREVIAEYETVKKGVVETISSIISLSKLKMEPIEEVIESEDYKFLKNSKDQIVTIAERYGKVKKEIGAMDFDDILSFAYILLRDNETIRRECQERFSEILVDEFQDTDRLQAAIVRVLHKKGSGLLVVGDDSQSIYSFRGARIENILEFEKEYSAEIYYLVSNYRSTDQVVKLVNASMKRSVQKLEKKLISLREGKEKPLVLRFSNREEEALEIGERIKNELGLGHTVGVLFRAAYYASELELYLTRNSIEYEMRGGLKFFEQRHIKDMVALLRAFNNPRDITAIERLLLLFPRVGEKGVERELPKIREVADIPAALSRLEKTGSEYGSMLKEVFESKSNAAGMLDQFYGSFYKDYLKEKFEDFAERAPDIDALVGAAAKYPTVQEFLDALSLDGGADEKDKPVQSNLILSTIHQAKGLEWDSVFIICLADGMLPLGRTNNVEEERRLFYVAISRAKDRLVMSYPEKSGRFYDFDILEPSRFLLEIPEDLYERGKIRTEY